MLYKNLAQGTGNLFHFFLFFLPLFSLVLSLSTFLKVIVINSYKVYPLIPNEKLLFFSPSFSFRISKEKLVGLLDQNSTNIHQPILYGQKMILRDHMILWYQEEGFYRNHMDEVELRGGREKEPLVPLGHSCLHAFFFLEIAFSLIVYLCLWKSNMSS